MPLDPERREETEVYLAFATRALVDPGLRVVRDDTEQASRQAVRHALGLLADVGMLGRGHSVEDEADATYHLLDGLALHGTLWPGRYPPSHLRAVLDGHLRRLAAPSRRDPPARPTA